MESYRLIIILQKNICKMNQDFNPIKEIPLQKMQIDALEYEINQIEQLLANKLLDRNTLTSNVLFVCQNCNGPLIPSSICMVCHKASIRICQKCGVQKKFGFHLLCSYLVLLNENKKTNQVKDGEVT